jgi:hypothetical protein
VDWTPLKNLDTKFTRFGYPAPAEADMWQFTSFFVDPRERMRAKVKERRTSISTPAKRFAEAVQAPS